MGQLDLDVHALIEFGQAFAALDADAQHVVESIVLGPGCDEADSDVVRDAIDELSQFSTEIELKLQGWLDANGDGAPDDDDGQEDAEELECAEDPTAGSNAEDVLADDDAS